jgi:serine/threonine-protein kinase
MERIGRYKIVRELGRGAMGVVYHAIDPNIGRPVAIKTIHLGARKPEEMDKLRERLFREARSAGILSHPGIVTIYDVEQQGELAYIAMEFVDGETLDHVLSASAPIAPLTLINVLAQTAVALDYAHGKGIVHRDIKPANIMIARDGAAKITDFGIAKITASDQLTMTGAIVGTPHYMSPEQVQGHPVDGRSDQFSLAVIAYEALTGEKPYTGEHLTTVVYKIVTEDPPPPHRLNPSLSGPIDTVLRKALSKKPDARHRNCQDFIDSLEKACGATKGWKPLPRGGSLNEPTVADVPPPPRPEVTLPRGVRPARLGDSTVTSARAKDRKSSFFTFLLAVLVTGGLIALIALQAPPWLTSTGKEAEPPRQAEAPTTPEAPKADPPKVEPPQQQPPAVPSGGDDAKPSPLTPAEPAVSRPEPPRRPAQPVAAAVQPITIISSPGGARAMLDGRSDAVCTTPCSVDAAPGRHTIAVTLDGYQTEYREVDVSTGPVEMTAVVLRTRGGTLMLTSVPQGAKVLVNDKPIGQLTPARIPLAPGSYKITVELDGRQASQTVQIGAGMSILKITL